MEASQLEELIQKIQQLQLVMIAVATGEEQIQNVEEDYTELYQEVELEIELLQEENSSISNPNSFSSLWDWHQYWSSNLAGYSSRRQYIYDLYAGMIDDLRILQHQSVQDSSDQSSSILKPEALRVLLVKIQDLKVIMTAVATGERSIQSEESNYTELYHEVSAYIHKLKLLGLLDKNPNSFGSLWHWHSYWKSELSTYALRRQFVNEFYTDITNPIQKALKKHQQKSSSTEEFFADLRRRFGGQSSEHLTISKASPMLVEQDTNIQADVLPAETAKVVEPDSEGTDRRSTTPKVFISYSHDSQEHKDRVWKLADRLRGDGVDCRIDQHEDSPVEGWYRWMLNQIDAAKFVLIVCTETYERRFQGHEKMGSGKGVTWEGGVIIQALYDAQGRNSKFIPIIFTPEDAHFIPDPLRSATSYPIDTAEGYDLLYRRLTDQPEIYKKELGQLGTLPPRDRKQTFQEDSSRSSSELVVIDEQLGASERSALADLLKRSGRADFTSRKALCYTLGLDPGNLNFIALHYSDKDFATELVNYLFETGHDLTKLCAEIQPCLQGQYAQSLQDICNKIASS